ncbi:hypothetical protein APSETT444_004916 [Aspergillus pseudonomiae]
MVSATFPLPGVDHGKRILATVIENRAKDGTNTNPWISLPINDQDLSAGYRDITFQQLNNAANHAAQWLSQALPATSEPFQCFAYAGPKDLRPVEMAGPVGAILQKAPHIESITVPGIDEFLRDDAASPVVYGKTWDEGKDDPWLVFHTSGTTDIFRYGRIDGALLMPALIDALCLLPEGIEALRELKYVHYAGAPLSAKSGNLLAPYTQVVPCVGSTEAGGYFTTIHQNKDAWDYLSFQKHSGAEFEHRMNDLHELVFVRRPECAMQQIFQVYPDRDSFGTDDLWIEHPVHKGLWKIIGRSDDYVYLAHGDGLHASLLEPEIIAHPSVKTAIIGGHGQISPVLLVELIPGVELDNAALKESLKPYIEKVNVHCHDCVKLSSERLIFATKDKPFILTAKGSVARLQTLALYEEEIVSLFA